MAVIPARQRKVAVRSVLVVVLMGALALVTLPRLMGQAAGEDLKLVASNWSGGGGRLTTGPVPGGMTLESSIGQPDAGVLTSGTLRLEGGFQHSQLALDVNCDDSVNSSDTLFALRYITGLQAQGACSLDANRDGSVNLLDPLFVSRKLAGLP